MLYESTRKIALLLNCNSMSIIRSLLQGISNSLWYIFEKDIFI